MLRNRIFYMADTTPGANGAERSIDDIILEQFDDLDNDDDVADDGAVADAQGNEDSQGVVANRAQEGTHEEAERTAKASNKGTNKQAAGKDGAGQQKQQGRQPQGAQDITLRDGTVIKGGNERRLWEQSNRERVRADRAETELRGLRERVTAFEQAGSIGQQLNLSPQHITAGAHLIKDWMASPVETIKKLLTIAQQNGHNIEGIGVGTDVNAIKSLITEHMKPFIEERQQKVQQTEQMQAAERVWNEFTSVHPDADIHVKAITHLLKSDDRLSLDGAYWKLQHFYQSRGLDWNVPLEEHVRRNNEGDAQVQDNGAQRREVPTRRTAPRSVQDNDSSLAATATHDDIIRAAMREAGFN